MGRRRQRAAARRGKGDDARCKLKSIYPEIMIERQPRGLSASRFAPDRRTSSGGRLDHRAVRGLPSSRGTTRNGVRGSGRASPRENGQSARPQKKFINNKLWIFIDGENRFFVRPCRAFRPRLRIRVGNFVDAPVRPVAFAQVDGSPAGLFCRRLADVR